MEHVFSVYEYIVSVLMMVRMTGQRALNLVNFLKSTSEEREEEM